MKFSYYIPLIFVLSLLSLGYYNGIIPTVQSDPYWQPPLKNATNKKINFIDVTKDIGIEHVINSQSPVGTFPFKINASVAATDLNNDGKVDFLFNDNFSDYLIYVYIQNKKGKFDLIKREIFYKKNTPFKKEEYANKVASFDYNNDGRQDILIVGLPHVMLLENKGNLHFEDISTKVGLDKIKGSFVGVNFFDFNHDGFEDIFLLSLAIYKSFKNDDRNLLLINNKSNFQEVTSNFFKRIYRDYTWSSIFGYFIPNKKYLNPDIYIQNDYKESRMFHFDSTINKYKSLYKFMPPSDAHGQMGGDTADLNFKNETELYSSNITKISYNSGFNYLLKANEEKKISNLAKKLFIESCGFSWGAKFIDANNDGNLELFVGNGGFHYGSKPFWFKYLTWLTIPHFLRFNSSSNPSTDGTHLADNQPSCFFTKNTNGTYENIAESSNLASLKNSRGVAVTDINQDGLLDLAVSNFNEAPTIYLNQSEKDNWIGLKIFRKNNFSINGTIVTLKLKSKIKKNRKEIFLNNGLAAQNENLVHFGLGKEIFDSIEVNFPSEKAPLIIKNLKINHYNIIYEK